MVTLKLISFGVLSSILAWQPMAAQERPPAVASPSTTGLLLARVAHHRGTDAMDDTSMVRYETLWIVRDVSGAHIAAKLPDIVVPRKAGFWRLGIEHTCQVNPPAADDPKDFSSVATEDYGYAVPVEQTPTVETQFAACDPLTAKRLLDDSYDQAGSVEAEQSRDPKALPGCGYRTLWFESVLPDFLSVAMFQGDSELCDLRGGNIYKEFWVQNPDEAIPQMGPGGQQIPFDFLFGDAGHRAWIHAVSGGNPEGDSCIADDPTEDISQTGWYLRHVKGAWRTSAFVQVGRVCVAYGDPKVAVPRSMTHGAPLGVPWGDLEKQLPGIWDAYLSPDGSVLVAIRGKQAPVTYEYQVDTITLFDFSNKKIGEKLLDIPGSKIVMAEWATGRYVQAWSETLTSLQSRGLPSPIQKVQQAPK